MDRIQSPPDERLEVLRPTATTFASRSSLFEDAEAANQERLHDLRRELAELEERLAEAAATRTR